MTKINAERAKALWAQADEFVRAEHDELMADPANVRAVRLSVRESHILGQLVEQAVIDSEEDIIVEQANGNEDDLLNTYRVRAVFKSIAEKFMAARANPNGHAGSAERVQ